MSATSGKIGFLLLLLLSTPTTTLSGCLIWHFPTQPENHPNPQFVHIIRTSGETLGVISQWYTGSAGHWREIERATPGLKANRLLLGQTVYIPEHLVINRTPLPREFVLKFSSPKPLPKSAQEEVNERPGDGIISGTTLAGSSSALDRQLYEAIKSSDSIRCRELIEQGANVNSGEEGRSLLAWAAQSGRAEIIAMLIANGAVIETIDSRGFSALLYAAASNQLPSVKTLLQSGADASIVAYNGKSALNLAIEHNNREMMQILIVAGADPGRLGGKGVSPLLTAIEHDSTEMLGLLLKSHADVNNTRGTYTPLSYAAARQNLEIIAQLIQAGADVNLAPEHGDAPLFEALSSPSVMRILFAAGATPNIRNQKGETPLAIAIQRGTKGAVATLLAAGSDVNMPTTSGQSPYALAMSLGESEIAALLKANGGQ